MKLSVLMITYKHERYVAQALTSVLAQTLPFDYEIVVGEDCSPDRTRDIALDFQRRFPARVRVLPASANLGAQVNFMRTYEACRGNYVALLDGDDFWTCPEKLTRQVEFLDRNPDHSFVFHDVLVQRDGGGEQPDLLRGPSFRATSSLSDLLERNFVPFVSVVARNRLFGAFPAGFESLRIGDWPFHMLNARHGSVAYLPDNMATYRVHSGGLWSQLSPLDIADLSIQVYQWALGWLPWTYRFQAGQLIDLNHFRAANYLAERDQPAEALARVRGLVRRALINRRIGSADLVQLLQRVAAPVHLVATAKASALLRRCARTLHRGGEERRG